MKRFLAGFAASILTTIALAPSAHAMRDPASLADTPAGFARTASEAPLVLAQMNDGMQSPYSAPDNPDSSSNDSASSDDQNSGDENQNADQDNSDNNDDNNQKAQSGDDSGDSDQDNSDSDSNDNPQNGQNEYNRPSDTN
jgi:hypothetical protein